MAKNARRVQRGMWTTSERRVRRAAPSRLVLHRGHLGDPDPRGPCATPRDRCVPHRKPARGRGIRGDSFAVSARFEAVFAAGGAAVWVRPWEPARRSAPNSGRGPPSQSARMSGPVPGVSTVIRPLRRHVSHPAEPRVRRRSASATGRVGGGGPRGPDAGAASPRKGTLYRRPTARSTQHHRRRVTWAFRNMLARRNF